MCVCTCVIDVILHPALECVRVELTESLVGVARLLVQRDNQLLGSQVRGTYK